MMDDILVDGVNFTELNQTGAKLDSDIKLMNCNSKSPPSDQTILNSTRSPVKADLNHNLYRRPRISRATRGTKRDRSESGDSTSSREDNECHKSGHGIKISSVLVHPNRASELADNEEKRRAILDCQRNDKQVFDRNRRMFGMLMGTLKQFKNEETTRERSTIRRYRVEEKLELAVEDERVNLERKVDQVREERVDNVELRLDITERFKNWERTHRQLCSYIQTETRPKIFWLPKELDLGTEKKLKETRDYFSLCVAERTAKLKKEFEELETPRTPDEESDYRSSSPDTDCK